MANIVETEIWSEGIYQIEKSDPVVGGADGISNKQAKQLAARTQWLKKELRSMGVSTEQFDQLLEAVYLGAELDKQGEDFKASWLLDSIKLLLKPYALKEDAVNGYSKLETDERFLAKSTADDAFAKKAESFGFGQKWQDMTSSRTLSTEYTNTSSKPISISIYAVTVVNQDFYLEIDGKIISQFSGTGDYGTVSAVVNPNSKYKVVVTAGAVSKLKWMEYR